MINHDRKFFTNLIEELDQDEKQQIIYDLMKSKIKKNTFSMLSFNVIESKGWFSKSITQKIQGFISKKFELKLNYEALSINKFHSLISTKHDLYDQSEEEGNKMMKVNGEKEELREDKIKKKIYSSNMFIWAAEKYPLKIKVILFLQAKKLFYQGHFSFICFIWQRQRDDKYLSRFLERNYKSNRNKIFKMQIQI